MGYFQVRYVSRVVIYKCKMFIRLATECLNAKNPKQLSLPRLPLFNITFIGKHFKICSQLGLESHVFESQPAADAIKKGNILIG